MSTAQGERRLRLAETRKILDQLPMNELFELPGRPHVVYQLRNYAEMGPTMEDAALQARNDAPFLFKAFETGQVGPKRLAKLHGDKPRTATIHEYLDWTVTAQAAQGDDELDFGGFRVLVILPRYRSGWPAPDLDLPSQEGSRKSDKLGAPRTALPFLQTHGKPLTAATIRTGPGYLEVPFVATHENKRGRGYCRCVVEAIEEIARALGINKLMLCSTNDPNVKNTWAHLGFQFTTDEQMHEWDILHTDLVYLQNTTQMHKDLQPALRRFKPVVVKHGNFGQRLYAFVGHKRPHASVSGPAPESASKRPAPDSVSKPTVSAGGGGGAAAAAAAIDAAAADRGPSQQTADSGARPQGPGAAAAAHANADAPTASGALEAAPASGPDGRAGIAATTAAANGCARPGGGGGDGGGDGAQLKQQQLSEGGKAGPRSSPAPDAPCIHADAATNGALAPLDLVSGACGRPDCSGQDQPAATARPAHDGQPAGTGLPNGGHSHKPHSQQDGPQASGCLEDSKHGVLDGGQEAPALANGVVAGAEAPRHSTEEQGSVRDAG